MTVGFWYTSFPTSPSGDPTEARVDEAAEVPLGVRAGDENLYSNSKDTMFRLRLTKRLKKSNSGAGGGRGGGNFGQTYTVEHSVKLEKKHFHGQLGEARPNSGIFPLRGVQYLNDV